MTLVGCLLAGGVACSAEEGSEESPSPPDYLVAVLSQDLSVGPQRVAFIVVDPERERIQVPQVELTTYYLGENREADGERRETVTGVFRPWPLGDTGLYSARVNFDEAGQWRAEVAVTPPGEDGRVVRGYFRVSERSFTPAIGSDAPKKRDKDGGRRSVVGTDHVVAES